MFMMMRRILLLMSFQTTLCIIVLLIVIFFATRAFYERTSTIVILVFHLLFVRHRAIEIIDNSLTFLACYSSINANTAIRTTTSRATGTPSGGRATPVVAPSSDGQTRGRFSQARLDEFGVGAALVLVFAVLLLFS